MIVAGSHGKMSLVCILNLHIETLRNESSIDFSSIEEINLSKANLLTF